MKRVLHMGLTEYEVLDWLDLGSDQELETFPDETAALTFLYGLTPDNLNMMILRHVLTENGFHQHVHRLDNREVVEELARLLAGGEIRVATIGAPRHATGGQIVRRDAAEAEEEEPEAAPAVEEEAPPVVTGKKEQLHWIDVRVTNGSDDPFDGEFYILYLSNGERMEGELDNDGRLRKEDVPRGDFEIEFPGLFELVKMENGNEATGSTRGKPAPLPPPPQPSVSASEESGVEDDSEEIDDDDDDFEFDFEDLGPELLALI